MARIIDQVIQTEIMAGSNVQYAGDATSRATIEATDLLTGANIKNAAIKLRSVDAPTIDGTYFLGAMHPFAA